jgi:hypothetical protein
MVINPVLLPVVREFNLRSGPPLRPSQVPLSTVGVTSFCSVNKHHFLVNSAPCQVLEWLSPVSFPLAVC